MSPTDSDVVLLTCSGDGQGTRLPVHGSRRDGPLAAYPHVALPACPGRADLDPVLAEHRPRRAVVAGTDADLAAVLLRLLRTERLDIELAYVPARRGSPAARTWGIPRDAAELAVHGTATPVPLVRDDGGGVLVGRGEIHDLTGECYCDETLVLRGQARRLVVTPRPDGIAVRAGFRGTAPDGRIRPVPPMAALGTGSALGRAVQIGCEPATVIADGIPHPRPLPRRTWYRHTADWLLVRPWPDLGGRVDPSEG